MLWTVRKEYVVLWGQGRSNLLKRVTSLLFSLLQWYLTMWAFYWDFSCCYSIDVFKKECKNAVLELNIVILIDKEKFIQSLDDLFLFREFHF